MPEAETTHSQSNSGAQTSFDVATSKTLVLENAEGQVVRAFAWDARESAVLVQRLDTKRVELHRNTDALTAARVKFQELATVAEAQLKESPLSIPAEGRLRLVSEIPVVAKNIPMAESDNRLWYLTLILVTSVMTAFVSFLLGRPTMTAGIEAELKQQVVQIVKKIPVKPQTKVVANVKTENRVESQIVKTTSKTAAIKRMGALAVFGSLNKSNQKGGIDLGAVNTTAGPGLGGTGGSGGVQTTLYGKGLVAAPVGAGGNLQGGGGYGTKGKGGGRAGYGKLSLIGSAGTNPIPLGREAIVAGGLDFDLVADVISKNIGQIRFCYEQGLQGDPQLAGRVEVAWTINGNGQVTTAGVANTTLNSKIVEDCILLRLRSWKFPLPEGGVDVKVSYPFLLRRSGQG
ncbi:MAG: AgmX/PglI C-terminal domain-containing protein [Bdellovibrionaceae bacterium]|nr:AgmX/PglI C-terminal domain-containing protein [Pseudobdellovibrionaceae bacterium]